MVFSFVKFTGSIVVIVKFSGWPKQLKLSKEPLSWVEEYDSQMQEMHRKVVATRQMWHQQVNCSILSTIDRWKSGTSMCSVDTELILCGCDVLATRVKDARWGGAVPCSARYVSIAGSESSNMPHTRIDEGEIWYGVGGVLLQQCQDACMPTVYRPRSRSKLVQKAQLKQGLSDRTAKTAVSLAI